MSDCKHSDRPMYMNISVTTLHSHIFNSIKGLVLRVVVGGGGVEKESERTRGD